MVPHTREDTTAVRMWCVVLAEQSAGALAPREPPLWCTAKLPDEWARNMSCARNATECIDLVVTTIRSPLSVFFICPK